MTMRESLLRGALPALVALLVACGGESEEARGSGGGSRGGGGRGGPPGMAGGPPGGGERAAVPVEATAVARRTISSFIETNGTLEAENDVDVVARAAGPVVQLEAEETMRVREGQLLARLDSDAIRAQLEISKVALEESKLAFERAERLLADELVSQEAYEDAKAAYDSARAQVEGNEIQLGYTEIRAPFAGQIVERYVKYAQNISAGEALFRISDFDPLLCPIQVPERNIPELAKGQRAFLEVEAWPEERFEARVLRISPVVDAATGTVRVTLEVRTRGKLRPGMFASVFLETEVHEDALVIPKTALAIDSIGDVVYVAEGGTASRREVELGVREGDSVEVLSGLADGEQVVTVGQDGLSDGTPIQVLGPAGEAMPAFAGGGPSGGGRRGQGGPPGAAGSAGGRPSEAGGGPPGGFGGGRPDLSKMTPEQIEAIKERMRAAGMTDEQIEQRLQRLRERQGAGDDASGEGSNGR